MKKMLIGMFASLLIFSVFISIPPKADTLFAPLSYHGENFTRP